MGSQDRSTGGDMGKGPFTPSESERKKDQRANERDQRKNFKHQNNFSPPCSLSLGVK